jgi:hypothetical protein
MEALLVENNSLRGSPAPFFNPRLRGEVLFCLNHSVFKGVLLVGIPLDKKPCPVVTLPVLF